MEDEINSLYKVIDDANLTKMDLESQIESMKEELTLLSKNHEEVSPNSGLQSFCVPVSSSWYHTSSAKQELKSSTCIVWVEGLS